MSVKKAGTIKRMKHWKNGSIPIDDTEMDYIVFGRGRKAFIMLPGLGDGLKSAKGMALPFSVLYRKLGAHYRVYAFSRRRRIPEGFTTRDMAEDVVRAMDTLGIRRAYILGVSMGGMIAQHLVANHAERVEKLVLCVTTARPSEKTKRVLQHWMQLAKTKQYRGFMTDMSRRIYSDAYFKKRRWMYQLMGNVAVPKSWDNYFAQTKACMTHDAGEVIGQIRCPVLVIGGEQDHVIPAGDSRRLAEAIEGSMLYLYPQYGHGAFEESKDFQDRLIAFLG